MPEADRAVLAAKSEHPGAFWRRITAPHDGKRRQNAGTVTARDRAAAVWRRTLASVPPELLDDAMNGHHVGLTGVDAEVGRDRHQGLAEGIEVLL